MTGLLLLGSLVVFFLVLGMLAREISEALLALIRRPKRRALSLSVADRDIGISLTPAVYVQRTVDGKWWTGSEWVTERTVASAAVADHVARAVARGVVGHA